MDPTKWWLRFEPQVWNIHVALVVLEFEATKSFLESADCNICLEYGLVDIAPLTKGTLSFFNLYVQCAIKKFRNGYDSPAP